MCLSTVDTKTRHVSKGYKVVWKTQFNSGPVCYRSEHQGLRPIPVGKWVDEADYRTDALQNQITYISVREGTVDYPTGFHVFTSKKSAMLWRGTSKYSHISPVIKVEVRYCVASGTQTIIQLSDCTKQLSVVVAKQIKVIEEV